ncbi:hypothetical protein OAK19_00245 [Aureispira]|nr:hypothetical protein [Aureispira sp.]
MTSVIFFPEDAAAPHQSPKICLILEGGSPDGLPMILIISFLHAHVFGPKQSSMRH